MAQDKIPTPTPTHRGDDSSDTGHPHTGLLMIEFRAPGASEFTLRTENVTPMQMLGVAAWLDWFAKQHLQSMTRSGPQIAVPHVVVPRGLDGIN